MDINKSMTGDVLDLNEEEIIILDDDSEVGNSFFEKRCHGLKILVLAPKPSDEISIAGAMILNLVKARAEIFVAFSAEDSNSNVNTRARETANGLEILGIKRDHTMFLGKSNSNTLKELILKIEADVIFCADFDIQTDYQQLSIDFDQAMGEILSRAGNKYQPEVYKSFAYSTAFEAIQDLHSDNLLETKSPSVNENLLKKFDLIDHVNYNWIERVRFPVPENCRKTLIQHNPIAKAMFVHKSQRNEWNTLGIINSDEIFFERRTDNLIYSADISATSGDCLKVRDFHIINTDNLNKDKVTFSGHIWKPDSNDLEKKLTLIWKNLQQIEQIKIYGDVNDKSTHLIKISFDKNSSSELNLPNYGQPCVINFPEAIFASRIELQLTDICGISEIEIFAEREPRRVIKPFIKMTVNDNFVYDYFIPKGKNRIELEIYRFHIEKPIELSVSDGVIYCSGKKFILQFDSNNVTVRAEIADEPEIFDQIKIHRKNRFYFWKLRLKQLIERMNIYLRYKFKFLR